MAPFIYQTLFIMKRIYFVAPLLLLVLLFSCSKNLTYYSHRTIHIPTIHNDGYKCPVDSDGYEISEIIHLKLPDDVVDVKGTPLFCNDRIYMYDVSCEYVLAFDSVGNFLYKVGGFGHARNEIVGNIRTFDVDRHTNYVHIYNREGMKILVFDDKGEYMKSVMLHDCLPSSIVIADDSSYIASLDCLSSSDGKTKLVILDDKGNISNILLESDDENSITCEGANTRPLFSDHQGNILYLSMLADSIVHISGDTIQSVFNMEFADGFLSESEIKHAKRVGQLPDDSEYIHYISKVAISDDYFFVEFYGKSKDLPFTTNHTSLVNKKTNREYHFGGGIMLPGIISCTSNTIVGDKLIWLITGDKILSGRGLYDEYEMISKNRAKAGDPPISLEAYLNDNGVNAFSKNLIDHPQDAPLILKIKLK